MDTIDFVNRLGWTELYLCSPPFTNSYDHFFTGWKCYLY